MQQVTFSQSTKTAIQRLQPFLQDETLTSWNNQGAVEVSDLINWLESNNKVCQKNTRFLQASLQGTLFNDLNQALIPEPQQRFETADPKAPWYRKLQFGVLGVLGTLLAVCDGFDGIASLLGLFSSVPLYGILLAGSAFSALSVVVFYGFDLVAIANTLGVKLSQTRAMLDVWLDNMKAIKQLRKTIDQRYRQENSLHELRLMQTITGLLIRYDESLNEARGVYQQALNAPYLNVLKRTTALISGGLFLSGGFFSGQSLALILGTAFLSTALSPMAWPVLVTGILAGLAAFSTYWFLERPGLENLVGRWFGLDQDKIEQFRDNERFETKLTTLHNHIEQRKTEIQLNHGRSNDSQRKGLSFFNRSASWPDLSILKAEHGLDERNGQPALGR